MKVEPYAAIDGVHFGSDQATVTAALGRPDRISQGRDGGTELNYPQLTARFASDKLVEVTVDSKAITLGSVIVLFERLEPFLKENDESVFDCMGFIVSPKYGIAFDPEFPSWVTVFPKERLAVWQEISRR
jgi:hypothetical protein